MFPKDFVDYDIPIIKLLRRTLLLRHYDGNQLYDKIYHLRQLLVSLDLFTQKEVDHLETRLDKCRAQFESLWTTTLTQDQLEARTLIAMWTSRTWPSMLTVIGNGRLSPVLDAALPSDGALPEDSYWIGNFGESTTLRVVFIEEGTEMSFYCFALESYKVQESHLSDLRAFHTSRLFNLEGVTESMEPENPVARSSRREVFLVTVSLRFILTMLTAEPDGPPSAQNDSEDSSIEVKDDDASDQGVDQEAV